MSSQGRGALESYKKKTEQREKGLLQQQKQEILIIEQI